ncbi:hypothetical protein RRG08_061192 [Elysia crispata]|uniref:Uncharacterized protein n=1 Tax=Elysia crispata TaxID=231223 RepID=A0AAE1DJX3_9GAST|nr:hypothetical protein RRG08_061192 [Elysia crispata]
MTHYLNQRFHRFCNDKIVCVRLDNKLATKFYSKDSTLRALPPMVPTLNTPRRLIDDCMLVFSKIVSSQAKLRQQLSVEHVPESPLISLFCISGCHHRSRLWAIGYQTLHLFPCFRPQGVRLHPFALFWTTGCRSLRPLDLNHRVPEFSPPLWATGLSESPPSPPSCSGPQGVRVPPIPLFWTTGCRSLRPLDLNHRVSEFSPHQHHPPLLVNRVSESPLPPWVLGNRRQTLHPNPCLWPQGVRDSTHPLVLDHREFESSSTMLWDARVSTHSPVLATGCQSLHLSPCLSLRVSESPPHSPCLDPQCASVFTPCFGQQGEGVRVFTLLLWATGCQNLYSAAMGHSVPASGNRVPESLLPCYGPQGVSFGQPGARVFTPLLWATGCQSLHLSPCLSLRVSDSPTPSPCLDPQGARVFTPLLWATVCQRLHPLLWATGCQSLHPLLWATGCQSLHPLLWATGCQSLHPPAMGHRVLESSPSCFGQQGDRVFTPLLWATGCQNLYSAAMGHRVSESLLRCYGPQGARIFTPLLWATGCQNLYSAAMGHRVPESLLRCYGPQGARIFTPLLWATGCQNLYSAAMGHRVSESLLRCYGPQGARIFTPLLWATGCQNLYSAAMGNRVPESLLRCYGQQGARIFTPLLWATGCQNLYSAAMGHRVSESLLRCYGQQGARIFTPLLWATGCQNLYSAAMGNRVPESLLRCYGPQGARIFTPLLWATGCQNLYSAAMGNRVPESLLRCYGQQGCQSLHPPAMGHRVSESLLRCYGPQGVRIFTPLLWATGCQNLYSAALGNRVSESLLRCYGPQGVRVLCYWLKIKQIWLCFCVKKLSGNLYTGIFFA